MKKSQSMICDLKQPLEYSSDYRKSIVVFIWISFAVFLVVLHQQVYIHFDDFGYGSLSYGWTGNQHGMKWTFQDLLSFSAWHYNNWGGRVLFLAALSLILRCGEWLIQIVQPVLIFVYYFLMYKLIQKKHFDLAASVISTLSFGLIGTSIANNGIFWYTASVLYFWPLVFLLGGMSVLFRKEFRELSLLDTMAVSILLFIAAFSHEQTAVLAVVTSGIWLFLQLRISRLNLNKGIVVFFFAFAGACIEIFAPGNFIRAEGNADFNKLSFFKKVFNNIPLIADLNIGSDNGLFMIMLMMAVVCICYSLVCQSHNKRYSVFYVLISAFCIFFGSMSLIFTHRRFHLPFQLAFLVLLLSLLTLFFIIKERFDMLSLLAGALCSQGMMVFSPTLPPRTALPLQIIFHVLIGSIFCIVLGELKDKEKRLKMTIAIIIVFLPAIIHLGVITKGYCENSLVNRTNHLKIKEKAEEIKNGVQADTIILYRLPNDEYAPSMPYQQDFIHVWVRRYYELPDNTIVIWNQYGQRGGAYEKIVSDNP